MRIVQVTAGTGLMYCGACLRDTTLVRALRRAGHDARLVPLYLPIASEGEDPSAGEPIAMGGVATWLAGQPGLMSELATGLERPLSSRWLLALAARLSGMTDPTGLGPLTQTNLQAGTPAMAVLLERAADQIVADRPDVVFLSNALLLGLAPALRERLDAPVLCTFQSEADFIEDLEAPWPEAVWETLAGLSDAVDGFVSVSGAHRREMCRRLGVAPETVPVVPHGVELDGYVQNGDAEGPPRITYLARLDERHGAGRLLEAFHALSGEHEEAHLALAGSMTPADRPFVDQLRQRAQELGLASRVALHPNITPEDKRALLGASTVLSVPTEREAAGQYVFEALASGCPVVAPRVGALVEWIEDTAGGLLYDPETPGGLATALSRMLRDTALRDTCSEAGQAAVRARYQCHHMANAMVQAAVDAGASEAPARAAVGAREGGGAPS